MEKLDSLLENRAEQEQKLRDLLTDENSLRKCLKQVNDDLDMQCTELSRLTETLRVSRNKMLHRVEQKKSHLVDLREMLFAVEKEERRTFSYRIIANESRALKKRIAEDNEEIKKQQRVVADLKATQRESRTRVKKILQEEKALWMKISEKVQWMVENGYPLVEPGNEVSALNKKKRKHHSRLFIFASDIGNVFWQLAKMGKNSSHVIRWRVDFLKVRIASLDGGLRIKARSHFWEASGLTITSSQLQHLIISFDGRLISDRYLFLNCRQTV